MMNRVAERRLELSVSPAHPSNPGYARDTARRFDPKTEVETTKFTKLHERSGDSILYLIDFIVETKGHPDCLLFSVFSCLSWFLSWSSGSEHVDRQFPGIGVALLVFQHLRAGLLAGGLAVLGGTDGNSRLLKLARGDVCQQQIDVTPWNEK